MQAAAGLTAFVTDADGFLGAEVVKVLVGRGSQVRALVRSAAAAENVRRAGATPVVGDVTVPGKWQDEVGAEWVFHVPAGFAGTRLTRRQASAITSARVSADAHLLDSVANGAPRRIVYAADTSCYGPTGPRPITADAPYAAGPWGRCFLPALDRLDGYLVSGLPIVTAFPGWIYGNGSWFRERVAMPVLGGKRVLRFGGTGPWISPIHVQDCARALVHLAERGEVGGRYFLVNSDPVRLGNLAETTARLAGRELRTWRVPAAATPLVAGPVLSDHLRADAVFANIRLRAIGFRFRYPSLEAGIAQILGVLND